MRLKCFSREHNSNQNRHPFRYKLCLGLLLKVLKPSHRDVKEESDVFFSILPSVSLAQFFWTEWPPPSQKDPSLPAHHIFLASYLLSPPLPCLSSCIVDTFVKWFDFSFMQALLKSNLQSNIDKETWQDKDFRLKLKITPSSHPSFYALCPPNASW